MKALTNQLLCFLFLILALGSTGVQAQGSMNQIYDLIFFTDSNNPFIVEINGVNQVPEFTTNARINGFNQPRLSAKVIFQNPDLGIVEKTLYMPETSSEVTYVIKSTRNGFKIRGFSMVPLPQTPVVAPAPGQRLVSYSTVPVVTQTTTTTTTTSTGNGMSGNVNIGVNGNMGVGINVNVGNPGVVQQTTTTTTTTTTGMNTADHYVMPGYNGAIGCSWPMEESDFAEAKSTIASKDWDETKLSIAKQIVGSNCLFADQVRDIVQLLEWEETKLEFAKFAYGRTFDIENYFKVTQAFEWEDSIEQLNAYIANYRF